MKTSFIIGLFLANIFMFSISKYKISRIGQKLIVKTNEAMMVHAELLTAKANYNGLLECIKKENDCAIEFFMQAE